MAPLGGVDAVVVGGGAIYLAALAVGGPALDDIRLGSRRSAVFPLAVIASVVLLGSLLLVGSSAGRTKEALRAANVPRPMTATLVACESPRG